MVMARLFRRNPKARFVHLAKNLHTLLYGNTQVQHFSRTTAYYGAMKALNITIKDLSRRNIRQDHNVMPMATIAI